jgi:capsid portal protein
MSRRATSLLHFKVYSALSPYGVPLWIGNTFSVFGSREADETNYITLLNNAIPSMFVVVENGVLTEKSIERLTEWVQAQIQQDSNMSKFIILEGETIEEGAPNPGQFRIRIEPLKQLQQTDAMFSEYNRENRDKIRQSFRLPPIFVGRAEDYTRATADTSRDIADEQVFAPERMRDDHLINRFILARWAARFHVLRHRHPNITDDIELIRLMAIAEKSGAMTPRRADRIIRDVFTEDIGPMPTGIDLDKPFSISFAEAQQGIKEGEPADQDDDTAQKMIRGLLDLRDKLEKEIDSRFLEEEAA